MPKSEQESFESVYRALESAVALLEDGGLPLNEAIAAFESGMVLAARCKALLDGAEARIVSLTAEFQDAAGAVSGTE